MIRCFSPRLLIVVTVLLSVAAGHAYAQPSTKGGAIQPRILTPAEFLMADSTYDDSRVAIPGEIRTRSTAEQDSAYSTAMALRIPAARRFAASLQETSSFLRYRAELERRPSIWEQIRSTMDIPSSILQPTPQERTQYQLTIANAMYVPGVLLTPMGTGNAMVSFGDIAKLFGIAEDVSPVIRYVVDETIEVDIVVYSTQAIAVSQPFRGIQAPGAYTLTWDGRDANGKTVVDGEYVAEVRLGNKRIMRKRITWKGK